MIRTTPLPNVSREGQKPKEESISFVSTCPKCGRPEPQLAFSRSALQRSLDQSHPIEAYCAMCDVFWRVSPRELASISAQLQWLKRST
jgi:hypothetical protein